MLDCLIFLKSLTSSIFRAAASVHLNIHGLSTHFSLQEKQDVDWISSGNISFVALHSNISMLGWDYIDAI